MAGPMSQGSVVSSTPSCDYILFLFAIQLRAIKVAILTCTIQWWLVESQSCATSNYLIPEYFIISKRNPSPSQLLLAFPICM